MQGLNTCNNYNNNMKIITYSKIGYNHPSQANWSYGIWKVDLIDTERDYNMSYTVKETFGGESRFKRELEKQGIKAIETKGVYPLPAITGIAKMKDIESALFLGEVLEFIK